MINEVVTVKGKVVADVSDEILIELDTVGWPSGGSSGSVVWLDKSMVALRSGYSFKNRVAELQEDREVQINVDWDYYFTELNLHSPGEEYISVEGVIKEVYEDDYEWRALIASETGFHWADISDMYTTEGRGVESEDLSVDKVIVFAVEKELYEQKGWTFKVINPYSGCRGISYTVVEAVEAIMQIGR